MMLMQGRIGCVAEGACADLIVVDGDPLADIGLLAASGARLPNDHARRRTRPAHAGRVNRRAEVRVTSGAGRLRIGTWRRCGSRLPRGCVSRAAARDWLRSLHVPVLVPTLIGVRPGTSSCTNSPRCWRRLR